MPVQVSQLAVECAQLRRENVTLQQKVETLIDDKDDLTGKVNIALLHFTSFV